MSANSDNNNSNPMNERTNTHPPPWLVAELGRLSQTAAAIHAAMVQLLDRLELPTIGALPNLHAARRSAQALATTSMPGDWATGPRSGPGVPRLSAHLSEQIEAAWDQIKVDHAALQQEQAEAAGILAEEAKA